tara:strand:+ start:1973 stop:3721 length:1749 start_codon:yes stop_codon:yes gene_type:complete
MIFNIYNFKLYSPNGDAEYSGGSEGGEKTATETGGGTTTGGGGTSGGGSTSGETDYEREIYGTTSSQDIYKAVYPTSGAIKNTISDFTTNKRNNPILKADGEKRQIIVVGTPGSIFTLTIEDSSGCSLLVNKLENIRIPVKGRYVLNQDFPAITSEGSAVKTKETYTVRIQPAADVGYGVNSFTLTQVADPVITLTKETSQTGPALTVSGSDITLTNRANSDGDNSTKTYTLTITENPEDSSGKLYYTGVDFNDNISSNTIIKKRINRDGENGMTNTLYLDNITTRTTSTIENSEGARIRNADGSFTENTNTTGDLEPGMIMRATVTEDKTVVGNLNKDNEIIDYDTCKTLPAKLKLSNTNDLFLGMIISGRGIAGGTYIESIDCDKNITISPKQKIRPSTTIRFKKEYYSIVSTFENTSTNKSKVILSRPVNIPDGTEIEFDDNKNLILGITNAGGSGTDTVTLTNYIKPIRFGDKNVTFTLDLDKLVTSKPNAYNITTTTKRNTAVVISMIQQDTDANASSKTGTIVENPQNGTVRSYVTSTDSFTYTPAEGFTGEDSFTFTMSDGTNSSDEKTVIIKVI